MKARWVLAAMLLAMGISACSPADKPFDVLLTNASEGKVTTVPKGATIKVALDLSGLDPDPISLDRTGVLEIEQQLRPPWRVGPAVFGDQWTAYVRAKEVGTDRMTVRLSLACGLSCRGAGTVRAPILFRIEVTPG
jgi:hypothetical protein